MPRNLSATFTIMQVYAVAASLRYCSLMHLCLQVQDAIGSIQARCAVLDLPLSSKTGLVSDDTIEHTIRVWKTEFGAKRCVDVS